MNEDSTARMLRLCGARRLPGIEADTSYGKPALKVGGKAFTGWRSEAIIPFRLSQPLKDMLLAGAPEIYFETDHYKGSTWLLVRFDRIGDAELADRLVDAWRLRAPKTLVRAYEQSRT